MTVRGFAALAVEALRELRAEKDVQIAKQNDQIEELKKEKDAELAALRADHADEVTELRDRLAQLERIETQLASEEE